MVLPIHETGDPEWPKWRWWIIRIAGASALFAGVWWLLSRDKAETLIAAAIPWAFVVGCLAISLIWAFVMVPLMVLIGRIGGDKTKGQNRTANSASQGMPRSARHP
jgi:peptidoglycan biosynthesis protein MviN/MurJ (putative lipid II flippase)